MEPAWTPLQNLSRDVSGASAARWRPETRDEPLVYPAVTVMMMEWKIACGLHKNFHRRLVFSLPPRGSGTVRKCSVVPQFRGTRPRVLLPWNEACGSMRVPRLLHGWTFPEPRHDIAQLRFSREQRGVGTRDEASRTRGSPPLVLRLAAHRHARGRGTTSLMFWVAVIYCLALCLLVSCAQRPSTRTVSAARTKRNTTFGTRGPLLLSYLEDREAAKLGLTARLALDIL